MGLRTETAGGKMAVAVAVAMVVAMVVASRYVCLSL